MFVRASSPRAAAALALVQDLQARLVRGLGTAAARAGVAAPFTPTPWLRDGGSHGGGERWSAADGAAFDRASVNVSQVHYDDLPDRRLASATALSAIVHPRPPRAPSVHLHTSWTELRDGTGYWRVMADLNPSHPDPVDTAAFTASVRAAAGPWWAEGAAQGDRYFAIPALDRTRGVVHFYLEQLATPDPAADAALARGLEEAAVDAYVDLLGRRLASAAPATEAERATQRAYHTLYLFQVLLLDRGTTSGLLVHDQNDVGILGSLPSRVDPDLLRAWRPRVPQPLQPLLDAIVEALPDGEVGDERKLALARAIRAHFRAHPEALDLQARGDVVPPTVANHR